MSSLLNSARPPVFCPGCTHDRIVHGLDRALESLGISGSEVVIVSDIGCSGLVDVFFHSHAFHGLHGRALTYALGLKMTRPELHVVVTMGDGGMGIGGAHILESCRRNPDLTLLVLNNFNYGMTGGQYSATTPAGAQTSSDFLGGLEPALDICRVAEAAGAPFVKRCSGLAADLPDHIAQAVSYRGFAVVDIWGICPGRYSRRNRFGPRQIEAALAAAPPYEGPIAANERPEYVSSYLEAARRQPSPPSRPVSEKRYNPPQLKKSSILILGSAGQRIVTAGELLALAGLAAGLQATQKNDHDITVLRGPSVSEVILWPGDIGFTAIERPDVVVVLAQEGVKRRGQALSRMGGEGLVIAAAGVELPPCLAEVEVVDFQGAGITSPNWALAALALLAARNCCLSPGMLEEALQGRFGGGSLEAARETVATVYGQWGGKAQGETAS